MPFLLPNQQRQSTEGKYIDMKRTFNVTERKWKCQQKCCVHRETGKGYSKRTTATRRATGWQEREQCLAVPQRTTGLIQPTAVRALDAQCSARLSRETHRNQLCCQLKTSNAVRQGWANYGPRAACGPPEYILCGPYVFARFLKFYSEYLIRIYGY